MGTGASPAASRIRIARLIALLAPPALAVYAITYGLLSGTTRGHPALAVVCILASAGALYAFRWEPALPVACAMVCWSFTGSALFAIVSFLLGRHQPRMWWAWVGAVTVPFPIGLVPQPHYFQAGFSLQPPPSSPCTRRSRRCSSVG
jgi:hypothetical protein